MSSLLANIYILGAVRNKVCEQKSLKIRHLNHTSLSNSKSKKRLTKYLFRRCDSCIHVNTFTTSLLTFTTYDLRSRPTTHVHYLRLTFTTSLFTLVHDLAISKTLTIYASRIVSRFIGRVHVSCSRHAPHTCPSTLQMSLHTFTNRRDCCDGNPGMRLTILPFARVTRRRAADGVRTCWSRMRTLKWIWSKAIEK